MNAKKLKKLRKAARINGEAAGLPARGIGVGKVVDKSRVVTLDFEHANRLAEELADLAVHEHVAGSVFDHRERFLAAVMKQYQDEIERRYTAVQIDAGEHEAHEPVDVVITEKSATLINDPHTIRGLYRRAKALMARVERVKGRANVRYGAVS